MKLCKWIFLGVIMMGSMAIKEKYFAPISSNKVGVYWGAFDPPTSAHYAIMEIAIQKLSLKELIVVVNNNSYKNYTHSLTERRKMIENKTKELGLKNIRILHQDDSAKINYLFLRQLTSDPLYAIAGYDAYHRWRESCAQYEGNNYDAIVVVPRGDEEPILLDENAFLLPIDPVYKYVSSSRVKNQNASLK